MRSKDKGTSQMLTDLFDFLTQTFRLCAELATIIFWVSYVIVVVIFCFIMMVMFIGSIVFSM